MKLGKIQFILILLILFLTLIMSACDMATSTKSINVLLKPMNKNDVLDPSYFRFVQEYTYLENLSLRLIELNNKGEYIGQLAKKITIKNNRKDYYFQLKSATYSDGTNITPHDVINSFKRLILLGSPHSNPKEIIRGAKTLRNFNDDIDGLKIVGTDTVFIGLNQPMKELFYYLQLADYSILHPSQYNKKGKLYLEDWSKVTSGAYKITFEHPIAKVSFTVNRSSLNYNKLIPEIVIPKEYKSDELVSRIKSNDIHFGLIHFFDFKTYRDNLLALDNIDIFSGNNDLITYIVLNEKSKLFSPIKNRQWFLKSILKNFQIDKATHPYANKAYQYFLPNAKGYVNTDEIWKLLNSIDTDSSPKDLNSGLTITTLNTMHKYLLEDIETSLSSSLNIPIKINYSISPSEMFDFLGKRNFDAFVITSGMSYKVIGETLNLIYTSKNPILLDPSNKINKLLNTYQKTDDPTEEEKIIHEIIKQMITDGECIPLYYTANPFFYNNKLLNIDNVYIEETPQFWKIHVKN